MCPSLVAADADAVRADIALQERVHLQRELAGRAGHRQERLTDARLCHDQRTQPAVPAQQQRDPERIGNRHCAGLAGGWTAHASPPQPMPSPATTRRSTTSCTTTSARTPATTPSSPTSPTARCGWPGGQRFVHLVACHCRRAGSQQLREQQLHLRPDQPQARPRQQLHQSAQRVHHVCRVPAQYAF